MILGSINKKYLFRKLFKKCVVCKGFKPTIPKLFVGNLFMSDKMAFNNVARIDLKQRKNILIINMTDAVTRYIKVAFIKDKNKGIVVNIIIELWLPHLVGVNYL